MSIAKIILIAFVSAAMVGIGVAATNPAIQLVFLTTDILVYFLTFAVLYYVYYASKREHLCTPWRYIFRRPVAMSALVILLSYVAVGLLDSMHYRQALEKQADEQTTHYAGELLTVLDVLLVDLREQHEKTYSAPFATELFVKETIESDGSKIRTYPRLKYGGDHLQDPELEKIADITLSLLISLAQAVGIMFTIFVLLAMDLSQRGQASFNTTVANIASGASQVPWRVMLVTGLCILFLLFAIGNLGPHYHILGTDKIGQDVLYLAIKSIRTGLVIGTLTTLIMLPFAVLLGIMAGYYRGRVDDFIQYLYTTLSSIPGVLLIAASILTLQVYMDNNAELFKSLSERADLRLLFLCIILGITSWTGLCRMLRGETLKLSEMDYIQAATAFGVSRFKIILRHILPNVMHIVLIAIVLDFSGLVLAEAVLSYVGVGVDPSMISWGNMINSARLEMAREPAVWWSLVAAFIFMFVLVLAANLFSDAVRDAFDPRLTRSK